jgi:hypothetical protein
MISLVVLKAVADYAGRAVGAVLDADAKTRARWRLAVPQLQDAVLETQLYLTSHADGQPADRDAEKQLVRLWRDAATAFYTLDGRLAERLQLKAEYWTEPNAWTRQQIVDAGIALQHVAEHTRQLLHEGR